MSGHGCPISRAGLRQGHATETAVLALSPGAARSGGRALATRVSAGGCGRERGRVGRTRRREWEPPPSPYRSVPCPRYVEEMTRVLKPGGTLVIATWCQREETAERPFTEQDKTDLQFLYEEWAHPYFVSIEEYGRLMNGTGKLEVKSWGLGCDGSTGRPRESDGRPDCPFAPSRSLQRVGLADWTPQTIDSWRHSIWVGVFDPWIVISKGPKLWYKASSWAGDPGTRGGCCSRGSPAAGDPRDRHPGEDAPGLCQGPYAVRDDEGGQGPGGGEYW